MKEKCHLCQRNPEERGGFCLPCYTRIRVHMINAFLAHLQKRLAAA